MEKAIIHKDTGVIRRLTTDDNPQIGLDEEIIIPKTKLDLSSGFAKLDKQGNVGVPTEQEIDDADVDDARIVEKLNIKRQRILIAVDGIINDNKLPASVKEYFAALKELR